MSTNSDETRFLQAVFPDYVKHAIFVCDLAAMWPTRDLDKLDATRDCFWSIAAFPDDGWTDRKLVNASEVRALVIDDVGTKIPEIAVTLALGAPTAVVETSAGNFQWVYRLATPVPIAEWPEVIAEFEALVRHPLDGKDAVHLFRLPMGVNTKPGKNGFAPTLVSADPKIELPVPEAIASTGVAIASGPGPSSSKGLSGNEVKALMDLIPNDLTIDREAWIEIGHGIKALAENDEEGFEVFNDWSATWEGGAYDEAYTRKRWDSFGAGGLLSKGGKLRARAQAANPEGFARWDAKLAFDDGEDLPAGDAGSLNFAVDQEKSSIAVLRHLRGTVKSVGRDDWREFTETTGRWQDWRGNHMGRVVLELVNERKNWPMDAEVAKKLQSAKFILGIAQVAAMHRSVIAEVTDFDRDPLLLGVPSGVVDLRKGASRDIRKGRASEMISKSMWVDPAPAGTPHPEWSRFLAEFTQNDAALEEWLQVRAGYCLTGLMDEPIMPFYYGSGGNGKSVYLNALRSIWGEYGTQIEHRLMFEKHGGFHLAPLAVLAGIRLAIVTDVPQGASWDVHIMKMLTGDDAITANRMHQDPITFKSTAKVDVSGNDEPMVRDMDDGIRRRLKLIPLKSKPRVIDKQLGRKLVDEWPAIFRWALTGLDLYWSLGGFPASKVVDDATREYHAMLDPFQRWIDKAVVKDGTQGAKISTGDLFRSWDAFRSGEGKHGVVAPNSTGALTKKMKDKGFGFNDSSGYSYLWGYKLAKTDAENVF